MNTNKKRIEYLDIAKGVGILLVVWTHAKAPGHIDRALESQSGICYNKKATYRLTISNKINGSCPPPD